MRSNQWLRSSIPVLCLCAAASACGNSDDDDCAPAASGGTQPGSTGATGGTRGGNGNANRGGNSNGGDGNGDGGEDAAGVASGGRESPTSGGRGSGTAANGGSGDEPGDAGGEGPGETPEPPLPLRWLGPCTPLAVSDDGQTVLAVEGLWNAKDGWQTLPDLPGGEARNTPVVMSGDGRVVYGSSSSELGDELYRFTRADGIQGLGRPYVDPGAAGEYFAHVLHSIDTSRDGLMLVGFGTFLGGETFRWTPGGGFTDLPFPGLINEDAPKSAVLAADGRTAAFTGHGGNGLPVVISTPLNDVKASAGTSTAFPTAIAGDGSFVALFFPVFGGVNGLPVDPAVCLSPGEACDNTNVAAFDLDEHAKAAVGVEYLGGMGEREPLATFYWSEPAGIWHLTERLLLDEKPVDVAVPSPVALSSNGHYVLAQGTRHELDGGTADECFLATLTSEPSWPETPALDESAERPPSSLALGGNSSCALESEGAVRCWGQQLAKTSKPTGRGWSPQPLTLPGPAAQVSVGAGHACALLRDGNVQCWGDNSNGQLGDGTITSRAAPKAVPGLSEVTQLVANEWGSCALLEDATVKCWGRKVQGVEMATAPITIDGLEGAQELAANAGYTCARLEDGSVSCWGEFYFPFAETYAYLDYFPEPTAIPDLGDVTALAAGPTSICALRSGGEATCWGSLLERIEVLSPAPITKEVGLTNVSVPPNTVKLAAGTNALCALLADGAVQCSGWNQRGLLGSGERHSSLTLRPVLGLSDAVDLALGESHACARLAGGSIRCWGSNDEGQLGIGTVFSNEPKSISFPALVRGD